MVWISKCLVSEINSDRWLFKIEFIRQNWLHIFIYWFFKTIKKFDSYWTNNNNKKDKNNNNNNNKVNPKHSGRRDYFFTLKSFVNIISKRPVEAVGLNCCTTLAFVASTGLVSGLGTQNLVNLLINRQRRILERLTNRALTATDLFFIRIICLVIKSSERNLLSLVWVLGCPCLALACQLGTSAI